MAFAKPENSRSQVNRAGDILIAPFDENGPLEEMKKWLWASEILTNWRASHAYPINTFQATLRKKLEEIDERAIVAQRLKRMPSIIAKLQRFEGMKLARMQDIGGLRAVVRSIRRVRRLERAYRESKFKHELVSSKDYIAEPKQDGYRSVHLVFRYKNDGAPQYDGLLLELQLRTRLQHAWATAVETMGTFLGQALKSGQGEIAWREFFKAASAALAHVERTAPVPGFENISREDTFAAVASAESKLHVLTKLQGFSIAAGSITRERGQGAYHLVILDSANKSVSIRPYSMARLEQANADYSEVEKRAKSGEQIEAVLVSAGPVEALKKAYPNYFLDTQDFIKEIQRVMNEVQATKRREQ